MNTLGTQIVVTKDENINSLSQVLENTELDPIILLEDPGRDELVRLSNRIQLKDTNFLDEIAKKTDKQNWCLDNNTP